jgi:hypothetical protein
MFNVNEIDPYNEEYWDSLEIEEEEEDDFLDYIGDQILPIVVGTTGTSGSSGSIRDIKQYRLMKNYANRNKNGYLKQRKFIPVYKNNTRYK